MKVLIACEESQRVCIAFRERGDEAYSCDIQECSGGHPEWHFKGDALEAIRGGTVTTCDVCATTDNAKCKEFYSPEQDGLAQEWTGVCWCNPPYGREIGKWVRKAAESSCTVVMLLPARTDTKWFHDYIYGKAEIRFIKGRLKFGDAKNSAPFPSMVVIFKRESEKGNRI